MGGRAVLGRTERWELGNWSKGKGRCKGEKREIVRVGASETVTGPTFRIRTAEDVA